jgi:hypothetical protein
MPNTVLRFDHVSFTEPRIDTVDDHFEVARRVNLLTSFWITNKFNNFKTLYPLAETFTST